MIFSADSYSSSPSGWGWRVFFSGEGGCGSVQGGGERRLAGRLIFEADGQFWINNGRLDTDI